MTENKKDILLLTLGGTIESHYNPEEGTPVRVPLEMGSIIPEALEKLGLSGRCHMVPICIEDSSDLTPEQLQQLEQAVASRGAFRKVIVVQGTNTMPENAQNLWESLQKLSKADKTLIFTGAMQPLRDKDGQFRDASDGWANLQMAVEQADRQPAGAYVVIEAACHRAQDIEKWVEAGDDGMVKASGFTIKNPIGANPHSILQQPSGLSR